MALFVFCHALASASLRPRRRVLHVGLFLAARCPHSLNGAHNTAQNMARYKKVRARRKRRVRGPRAASTERKRRTMARTTFFHRRTAAMNNIALRCPLSCYTADSVAVVASCLEDGRSLSCSERYFDGKSTLTAHTTTAVVIAVAHPSFFYSQIHSYQESHAVGIFFTAPAANGRCGRQLLPSQHSTHTHSTTIDEE